MEFSNICPACGKPLSAVPCTNKKCKHCTKDTGYERLILKDKKGEEIECPHCGFVEEYSFWEVQNIELFITTQCAGWKSSLTRAAELNKERIEEMIKRKGDI